MAASEVAGQLYQVYDILKESATPSSHVTEFQQLLQAGSSGVPGIKRLAAQMVPVFAGYFPALATEVLDMALSMCEDDDASVCIGHAC